MFERFTDRARRAVVLAQEEARLLDHNFIGTEHFLLGLIHEGEGVAAQTLESLGVTLDAVRNKVVDTVGPGESARTGSPPFTHQAKKVLELSLREALQLGHNYIGTEHMLLGLVREGESVATQVLVALGADPPRVRQEVISRTPGRETEHGKAGVQLQVAERHPMIAADTCALCGRDLWEVERYVTAGAIRICEQCVTTAGQVLGAARTEGRGPELHLPPRVFGEVPDEHAVDEIVTAFERAFSGASGDAERVRYVEDPEGLRPYEEEAAQRHGQRLTGCQVERIRFTAADQARVRFALTLFQGGIFPIDGTAVRRDGQWKVSRETQADLLRRGGVHVPPPRPA